MGDGVRSSITVVGGVGQLAYSHTVHDDYDGT